jgi:hypothetical protein
MLVQVATRASQSDRSDGLYEFAIVITKKVEGLFCAITALIAATTTVA